MRSTPSASNGSIEMSADNIRVQDIRQADDRTLAIVCADGKQITLDVVDLRRRCPCAMCIDEWTGEKRLRPEDVPETVRPLRINSVGSYALQIQFNDGHGTGIYT